MSHRLDPLLDPRSIAILGASADPGRVGGMPLALLLQHGFAGRIYPINPKYPEIAGLACYPHVEALPEPVDLLVMAVAAAEVVPQLRRAAAAGVRAAIVFAAGFAEAGDDEGRRLQDELVACAREIGIPVAGPNCMGFANLDSHAYSAFASVFRVVEPAPAPRNVALVTQSGNVCASVYAAGRKRGVGFNQVVNTGNEACLEFSDYLDYYAQHPGTDAVVGYVEGLRDGDKFRRVAARLRDEGRLLALLKTGDTEKGAQAAASHTASLAGSHAVYRAAFDELGVIAAADMTHLADIAYLARFRHRDAGPRVAILTISGALGALLSDAFVKAGIDIPTLAPDVQEMLRRGIPHYGMVGNPVDLTGNVVNQHGFFADALAAVAASPDIDFVVVYAPGYLLDRLSDGILAVAGASAKLIAAIDTGAATTRDALETAGVPVFDDSSRAVAALASVAHWHAGRKRQAAAMPPAAALLPDEAARVLDTARAAGRRQLDEVEAKRLFAACRVPTVPEAGAATAEEAAGVAAHLGFPVVLKVLSADIAHKSEIGGVRLGLADADAVRRAFDDVTAAVRRHRPDVRIDGVVIQRQEASGTELLLGVTRDPVFGPVMTVGLGGVWTELFGDVASALLPVDASKARGMLGRLKAWPLLDGFRGAPPADVDGAVGAMVALSEAVLAAGGDVSEIEINPLIVRPAGHGVVAVDGLVALSAT